MPRVPTKGGWSIVVFVVLILGTLLMMAVLFRGDDGAAPLPPAPAVELLVEFERLPQLPDGHYVLWAQDPHGGELRVGAFRVLEGGALVTLGGDPLLGFPLREPLLPRTTVMVTVEPGESPADTRSARVLLRGALDQTEAELTPVLPEFRERSRALLAVPTGEKGPAPAGVWFARDAGGRGSPSAGLSLPARSDSFVYGGWVLTGADRWLPTGLFTDPSRADRTAPFSGAKTGWDVPGEDFLERAPEDLDFPLNLADGRTRVVVSLEPGFRKDPLAGERPYLPLLTARIPYQQKKETPFSLEAVDGETFPRGRAHLNVLK